MFYMYMTPAYLTSSVNWLPYIVIKFLKCLSFNYLQLLTKIRCDSKMWAEPTLLYNIASKCQINNRKEEIAGLKTRKSANTHTGTTKTSAPHNSQTCNSSGIRLRGTLGSGFVSSCSLSFLRCLIATDFDLNLLACTRQI